MMLLGGGTLTSKEEISMKKPIIGQEAICPDGLGRVKSFCLSGSYQWIVVSTYFNDRQCKWIPENVELIDPRGSKS